MFPASAVQLGSHRCFVRTTLPAPTHNRISRTSQLCHCAAPTREPASRQLPKQQVLSHLEQAFDAPVATRVPPNTAAADDLAPGRAIAAGSGLPRSAKSTATRRNIILLDGDRLESTFEHRAWVAGGMFLMGSLFAAGASQVHDMPSAASATAAAISGYLAAGKTLTLLPALFCCLSLVLYLSVGCISSFPHM